MFKSPETRPSHNYIILYTLYRIICLVYILCDILFIIITFLHLSLCPVTHTRDQLVNSKTVYYIRCTGKQVTALLIPAVIKFGPLLILLANP